MSVPSIVSVLMNRDGLSLHDAIDWVNEAREEVANGGNPEQILRQDFGLEPDFVWDLMP